MKREIFTDQCGQRLLVLSTSTELSLSLRLEEGLRVRYTFDDTTFAQLYKYIHREAEKIWGPLEIHPVKGVSEDYTMYKQKKYKGLAEGTLKIGRNKLELAGRASWDYPELFQYTKRKVETFLFDFRRIHEGKV